MVRQFGFEAYVRAGNNTSNITLLLIEEQQGTTNISTANRSKHSDFDYESAVSINDTVGENSHLEGVDLLDGILKSHHL
ncbi:hypothetical protein TELCIR_06265 [Teladorsagia circumcincta]|uniref:Uncharacterized protein n=1 Tax=Teladorsagia circumcincta TaxID=45464 RepID=A0A2G9UNL9_TELCI|nr:hypothetical protein TELCIR_06265 [Teladorsagia circumcincta]